MSFSSRSLASLLLVIISIVAGYFFVKPRWTAYSAAKSKVAAAQSQQDKLKLAQQQLNDFLDQYKKHSTDAATLNQALPLSQSQMANILNNLDVLTKGTGITLGTLNIVDTPESDLQGAAPNTVLPIDFSVSANGSFESFKAFLSKLETNLRIIDINNISLESGENDNIQFSMSFRTYFQQ